MIEAFRIVENQSNLYSYRATSSLENAQYLESVLESTKPAMPFNEWPKLIATPFRYPLPVGHQHQARFRPSFFPKNILYCSEATMTALYEHAYHFLKERIHLTGAKETGQRTLFSVFIHREDVTDIRGHSDIDAIMDKKEYSESHLFIRENPAIKVLCYPSCRDPNHGPNYAVFEISSLEKKIGSEKLMSFSFHQATRSILWIDLRLQIFWNDVC